MHKNTRQKVIWRMVKEKRQKNESIQKKRINNKTKKEKNK